MGKRKTCNSHRQAALGKKKMQQSQSSSAILQLVSKSSSAWKKEKKCNNQSQAAHGTVGFHKTNPAVGYHNIPQLAHPPGGGKHKLCF